MDSSLLSGEKKVARHHQAIRYVSSTSNPVGAGTAVTAKTLYEGKHRVPDAQGV
jgi:hypothetical protein